MNRMSVVQTFGWCLGVCSVFAGLHSAQAGPNAGGVLLVHAHSDVVVCSDTGSYCADLTLSDCLDGQTSYSGTDEVLFGVYGAFPGAPRVAGVTIGIEYDASITLSDFGHCGDFELQGLEWPASGQGTAITWQVANTASVQPFCWFVGYDYYGTGGSFQLIDHPSSSAVFADDDVPPNLDDVVGFGSLGFNMDGELVCPETVPLSGACCFDDGICTFEIEPDCDDAGGVFQGVDVLCELGLCESTPVQDATWGRLKSDFR